MNNIPKTKEELQAELNSYKQLYDHAPDMFISVNITSGRIESVNKTLLHNLGYKRDELIGKPIEFLYPEKYNLRSKTLLEQYRQGRSFRNEEYELLCKNGQTIPVLTNSEAIRDEEGTVVRSNSIYRDITNLKRKQAEMLRANRSLEEEVQERTRQLMKRNKELEQFAFVASHDLQEPLLTIANFSKLLLTQYKDGFDEPGQKSLAFIADATHRMQELVKALLNYGLIGQQQEIEKIDLEKVVTEALSDYQANIQSSDAKVTLGYLPTIHGLKLELRQLFQNLLSNCLKFKKEKQPCEIEIWAEKEDDFYHFRVKDNGIGIAEEHQQKIFKLFQRLHDHKTITGTGIGLAQCVKIVDMHGGEMWVESVPDDGSVFHFTLKKYPSILV